jgi:hypothetical protein
MALTLPKSTHRRVPSYAFRSGLETGPFFKGIRGMVQGVSCAGARLGTNLRIVALCPGGPHFLIVGSRPVKQPPAQRTVQAVGVVARGQAPIPLMEGARIRCHNGEDRSATDASGSGVQLVGPGASG